MQLALPVFAFNMFPWLFWQAWHQALTLLSCSLTFLDGNYELFDDQPIRQYC